MTRFSRLRSLVAVLAVAFLASAGSASAQSFQAPDWENGDPAALASQAGSMLPVSFGSGVSTNVTMNMLGMARLVTFSGGPETLPSWNTVFALLVLGFVVGAVSFLYHLGTTEPVIQPLPIRPVSRRPSDIPS